MWMHFLYLFFTVYTETLEKKKSKPKSMKQTKKHMTFGCILATHLYTVINTCKLSQMPSELSHKKNDTSNLLVTSVFASV